MSLDPQENKNVFVLLSKLKRLKLSPCHTLASFTTRDWQWHSEHPHSWRCHSAK